MQKSTPRDVFMYLLATITLYFSAGSMINLLFTYINVAFPDALDYYNSPGDAIRWSLALLIIIFPVYLWVSRFLHRDMASDPGKKDLKIRKWLLYFTLFLSALLAIGDLVALIYSFLGGEITTRFLLKVFSVLAVAASVFGFYLYDLRRDPGQFSGKAKSFVWIVIVAVLAVIAGGFFIAGSPFKQRLVRFDTQRVNDLQTLQNQIIYHWQQKGKLPGVLSDLHDSVSGFTSPMDPETNVAYGYKVVDKLKFELCATFDLSSAESNGNVPSIAPGPYGRNDNWQHEAGEQCFARTIDPDLYPVYPKTLMAQ